MDLTQEILADAPLAYFPCNEVSGTTAHDLQGGALTGTYSGSYTQGVHSLPGLGKGPKFNGGQISIPDHARLKPAFPMTLECWVNFGATNSDRGIVTKSSSGSLNDGFGFYRFSAAGRLEFYINAYTGGSSGSATLIDPPRTGAGLITTGEEHHLVGTYDGRRIELWWDGWLSESVPFTTPISHSSSPLLIANYPSSPGGFTGGVRRVAIYSRILPPARILAHTRAAQGMGHRPGLLLAA